jgi:hypothetical protein
MHMKMVFFQFEVIRDLSGVKLLKPQSFQRSYDPRREIRTSQVRYSSFI